jgi:predicted DNA binding CopG/RHH family protein
MKKQIEFPKFKTESEEADWWASREGRAFVKERSAAAQRSGTKLPGSRLVAALNRGSVQIAIRIPEHDLDQARKIATRKGIGYQTLLKMLVHEGLERESKRA